MVLAAVGEKNVWPSIIVIITACAEKNKLMVAAAVGE